MQADAIMLRQLKPAELDVINALIERAVMTWDLPERVKRLTLPSYRYNAHDLEHLTLMVAETKDQEIVGIAAWEQADAKDVPGRERALLLHGIYVEPDRYRMGIGAQLLAAAEVAARSGVFEAVLVKAQAGAEGFFLARGFEKLAVTDSKRDYPHRYWKSL